MVGYDYLVECGLFGCRYVGFFLWDFLWVGCSVDYYGLKDFDDIFSLIGGGVRGCRYLVFGVVVRL